MEIDEKNVRKAVEDWYEGTADDAQEALLRSYFAQTAPDAVPADLKSTAILFGGNAALSHKKMDERPLPLHRKSALWFWIASGVAAAILLLLIFSPFATQQITPKAENRLALTSNKTEQVVGGQCDVKNDSSLDAEKPVTKNLNSTPQTESVAVQSTTPQIEQTYGYDFDGSVITDENVAMQSTEYLSFLELLDENLSTISDF